MDNLEWVRTLYGAPMEIFSSSIRSMIVSSPGKELFCADYASIEARVLFWVARHTDGLAAFANDRPIYEEMAQVIYGIVNIEDVTKGQRQVGKQAILGCGYSMGPPKFVVTCENNNIPMTEELAKTTVGAYREAHQPVVECWSNIERAAIAATQHPGKKFTINRTTWWVENIFLWCKLPSGRRLAYYKPSVKYKKTPWGEKRPALYHWGLNSLTKQWEESHTYGGKLVENVVQAIARDLLAEAMLDIEKAGYEIVLTVHDEVLAEKAIGAGSLEEFYKLMSTPPAWADGCPVKVEGWVGRRFHK